MSRIAYSFQYIVMMKGWFVIILLFCAAGSGQGQSLSKEDLRFLNREIRFLNESIHRMVIVFQVYENYNSEVTQHVDLPTNEGIKNTSTHLPENLFADNNLVLRGDSPLELYEALTKDDQRTSFPINNWPLINQAKGVIDFLNKDRKKLDYIIENEDLEQFSNIQTIYGEIKDALAYYDGFRNTVKTFEKLHEDLYHDIVLPSEQRQVYTALTELHFDIKKLIRQLRHDNQSGVINGVSKLENELGWVKTCISQLKMPEERSDLTSAVVSIEKLISQIRKYINGDPIPEEYMPFGKGYYYHNYELLPKVNQYGSGYVWKLEEFFKKYNWPVINFLEEPHYLKIVYPERLPLEIMTSSEIDPEQSIRDIAIPELPKLDEIVVKKEEGETNRTAEVVQETPTVLEETKEPPLSIVLTESVKVDSAFFEIELFDHYRRDGDRVSINVNGEWKFHQISLEEEKTVLKLAINPGGSNYIIIRADNVGWRTPNTIGIRYRSTSPSESIFIKKDLAISEAIELKFTL